jgi:hypothetical protein
VRQPQIITRLLQENGYPNEIQQALSSLREEIEGGQMHPLREPAPDVADWNSLLVRQSASSWLAASWYLAEAYFYRRLLEAVKYFQPGPWQRVDPFRAQKSYLEADAALLFASEWEGMAAGDVPNPLEILLHSSLWGNRADLSNVALVAQARAGLLAYEERRNILINHTAAAADLLARGLLRVDFFCDNVGLDLLSDLSLTDYLLRRGRVQRAVFHLKDRPFFVSDAMPVDVGLMLERLRASGHRASGEMAERLTSYCEDGRLMLTSDPFWASGLMFRQMPARIASQLAQSDLVVLKGDVNYRRLLDDRHWPHSTPLEDCTAYFPARFLLLRTLKGEIMVGLAPGEAEAISAADPTWLTNGKRGIIQLSHAPRAAADH